MRIIHSISSWLPATENWIYNQIISLPEDIETHIICVDTQNINKYVLNNIHCLRDDCRGISYISERIIRKIAFRRQFGYWYCIANNTKPTIWHSHFAGQAWSDRHVVENCKAKHVISVYGADISQNPKLPPWDVRTPHILQRVDLVLCEGPCMARQVIGLGCPPQRVRIHHLGIQLDSIPFLPRKWELGTPLRVLIAGTFREKKGIPYAIEALTNITGEADLNITIIGDATTKQGDAEEKKHILAALERGGLIRKTRLIGFQPHDTLLEEAKTHHIFLAPSVQASNGDNEGGSPVVITEMAASGMVVISSRHCDIPEVIIDGVTGLLADERDVAGLVYHLRWLISNPEKWLTLQNAARNHIEQEYNASVQGVRLASIYRELLVPQLQNE